MNTLIPCILVRTWGVHHGWRRGMHMNYEEEDCGGIIEAGGNKQKGNMLHDSHGTRSNNRHRIRV